MKYRIAKWCDLSDDELLKALGEPKQPWGYHTDAVINSELFMVANELRARLQRTDVDVQAPKNFEDNTDLTS